MTRIQLSRLTPVLFAVLVLMMASIGFAQSQANTQQVPAGQKTEIEGVVVSQQADSMTVRGTGGGLYTVSFARIRR